MKCECSEKHNKKKDTSIKHTEWDKEWAEMWEEL